MRTSFYTLVIDTDDDDCLVLHQPHGRMDSMSRTMGQQIIVADPSMPEELREYALAAGYLTTMSEQEEERWFSRLVSDLEDQRSGAFASPLFSFVTTYSCNLACSYCFQANTGIRKRPVRYMSLEVARQCLRVVEAAPRHPARNVVELFGGEPLLPNLRSVVEEIVLSCETMGLVTRATTNGVFLQDFCDLLGPSRLAELQISLDGTAEYHDRRRIPVNGQPTFDTVWSNIQLALEKGTRVMVRANLDRRNIENFSALAEFLDQAGFLDHPLGELGYVDVQPDPLAPDFEAEHALSMSDVEQFLREASRAHPVLRKIAGPHEIGSFEEWVGSNFLRRQTRHCGAVTNNVYFAPDLQTYSCHETAGRQELATGRVMAGRIHENESAKNWRSRRVDALPQCRRCPHALQCSGGCAARTDILAVPDTSYCNGFDDKFRRVIQRQYEISRAASAPLETIEES